MGEEGRRFKGKRRRKVSFLTTNKIDTVDYKDINILRRFLNDRAKILPSRQSGTTAKQQRMIASAIHRAREMALLPFVVGEMQERREPAYRRDRDRDRDRGPQTAPAPAAEPVVEQAIVEPAEASTPVEPVAEVAAVEPVVEAAAEPVVEAAAEPVAEEAAAPEPKKKRAAKPAAE